MTDKIMLYDGDKASLIHVPKIVGWFSFSRDMHIKFGSTIYPNAFRRMMLRMVFGIHWKRP